MGSMVKADSDRRELVRERRQARMARKQERRDARERKRVQVSAPPAAPRPGHRDRELGPRRQRRAGTADDRRATDRRAARWATTGGLTDCERIRGTARDDRDLVRGWEQ